MGMAIKSLTLYENSIGVFHVSGFNYPQQQIAYTINIGYIEFYYVSNGTKKNFIIKYSPDYS